MDVTLTAEMEQFVHAQVEIGRYATPGDVVRAAIADLMRRETRDVFRSKIAAGLQEARAGKLTDGEAFFDALEREDR